MSKPRDQVGTWLFLTALLTVADTAASATLSVGPGQRYAKPSQAFEASQDGDTIRIYGESYIDDIAVVTKHGPKIEGSMGVLWLLSRPPKWKSSLGYCWRPRYYKQS